MKAIGLQKKQRPGGPDPMVRSTSGFDGPMQPGIPPGLQPYSAIPPHMQGLFYLSLPIVSVFQLKCKTSISTREEKISRLFQITS